MDWLELPDPVAVPPASVEPAVAAQVPVPSLELSTGVISTSAVGTSDTVAVAVAGTSVAPPASAPELNSAVVNDSPSLPNEAKTESPPALPQTVEKLDLPDMTPKKETHIAPAAPDAVDLSAVIKLSESEAGVAVADSTRPKLHSAGSIDDVFKLI